MTTILIATACFYKIISIILLVDNLRLRRKLKANHDSRSK